MTSTYKEHLVHIRRAAAILDEIKVAAGCVDCGFNTWPESLHFDHVDPLTKQLSLGWVHDRSKLKTRNKLNRYIDHVSKYCVVRCANCHAHRTQSERQWLVRRDEYSIARLADPTLF